MLTFLAFHAPVEYYHTLLGSCGQSYTIPEPGISRDASADSFAFASAVFALSNFFCNLWSHVSSYTPPSLTIAVEEISFPKICFISTWKSN